jgi:hypothetical protein
MLGIDEEITFRRNDRRWDAQNAAARAVEPSVTDSLQRSWGRVLPPSAGQLRHGELGELDAFWDEDLYREQIRREEIDVAMDEHFETGKCEGLGSVGD